MIKTKHNVLIAIGVLLVVAFLLWGLPSYNVWQKELAGKAEFKQAEWNRQILIKEAEANLEAEKLNAKAEVERAKGVAEANKIIGSSLEESEAYLRYLWIQGLQDGSSEVIYVPTEANLPILEAGRFG
jgi:aminopeptidase-like protein